MRLRLILPQVRPSEATLPLVCPYEGCQGTHFRLHQGVRKPFRDTAYREVEVERHQCLRCGRTFRAYPEGASRDQISLPVS